MSPVNDRAGERYWSGLWSQSTLPRPVDTSDQRVRNRLRRQFGRFFRERLVQQGGSERALIEIGCARSPWLSYFAREHALDVSGLDYSPLGCEQARAMLERDGVRGEIIHADLFDPPARCLGAYDFVISFGVVEHFDDTVACLRAFGRFLRPGGRIYTVIPNFVGLLGALQRRMDRTFFEMHVPLDEPALRTSHEAAGFRVLHSDYFLSTNFGVLNHSTIEPGTPSFRLRAAVRSMFVGVSGAVWGLEDLFGADFRATRWLSPYVHCVGEVPPEAASQSSGAGARSTS